MKTLHHPRQILRVNEVREESPHDLIFAVSRVALYGRAHVSDRAFFIRRVDYVVYVLYNLAILLFGRAQGGFGLAAPRHVNHHASELDRLVMLDNHRNNVSEPHYAAICGNHAVLKIVIALLASRGAA